jgi:hypothetical protein
VLAGGIVWLFQDELFHPFGDVRACERSDEQLPGVIGAGGASVPADASDIHYSGVNVLVERSPTVNDSFRTPARARGTSSLYDAEEPQPDHSGWGSELRWGVHESVWPAMQGTA